MPSPVLLTKHRKDQLDRERKVYARYHALMALPGAMPTAVEKVIMREYNLKSRSTVFTILKCYKAKLLAQNSQVTPAQE